MSAPAGWEGILDDDEQILWQGRPDPSIELRPRVILPSLFGLVFAGFALFWMVMASQAPGNFWMFGLIHFSVGVGLVIGPILWPAWKRRHTWYTLSDRRAFIASDVPFRGRKLDSFPITDDTVLSLEGADPGTIHFAHRMKRTKNGSRRVDIGFERIEDARAVYGMMRDVQKGTA